jgi:hypothetical protein
MSNSLNKKNGLFMTLSVKDANNKSPKNNIPSETQIQ